MVTFEIMSNVRIEVTKATGGSVGESFSLPDNFSGLEILDPSTSQQPFNACHLAAPQFESPS